MVVEKSTREKSSKNIVKNTGNRLVLWIVLGFTLASQTEVTAQLDSASFRKEIDLEEIQVSARRTPVSYSEVGRVVTVISKKEIEALPVQSVDQLLEYVAHVDVRQRGPLGIQSDVSVRGGSFDQVMILLNGINITDPQTGHHSLNLPVDFQSIQRVEILEGPGARVFGSNAFSGAINFITGTEDHSSATVNGLGGENGLYSLGVNSTIVTGEIKNFVAANKSASDGYINNTDFDLYNLFYHGQLNTNKEIIELQAGYTDKSFGANSFYTARYPNQFEQTKTTFASLSMASKSKNPIKSSVYWRRHQDRFELYRGFKDAASWYTNHNYHLTDVFGANVNVVINSLLGKTAIGGDLRSESIFSNVLGEDMSIIREVPGEENAFFTQNYNRSNTSFFLEHSYRFENLSVSGGLMANMNSDLGYKFNVFKGYEVSCWVTDELKLFSSYNESLRMPTYTDLFYNGPNNIGNPDLKPEEASSKEFGLRYRNSSGIYANLSYFERKGKNMIDWGKPTEAPADTKWTTSNINKIKTYGIETVFSANLLKLIPSQAVLQSINLNYSWLDQDKLIPSGYESVYVFDYLKHKFSGSLSHKIYSNLSAVWTAQFQDRMGEYSEYDSTTGNDYLKEYKPFWVFDLKISWNKPSYKIFVETTNLLDKKYTDIGQLYQPGRWVKAGFSYTFSFNK